MNGDKCQSIEVNPVNDVKPKQQIYMCIFETS